MNQNKFLEKFNLKTDSELEHIISDKITYVELARIAAIELLEKRNVKSTELDTAKTEINEKIIENEVQQTNKINNNNKFQAEFPNTISNAAKLIYLSLIFGLINTIIFKFTNVLQNFSNPKELITTIISVGLMIFIAYNISTGKKWARTVFLVFSIIGFIIYPFILIEFFRQNLLVGILSIISTSLQIYSLILLYKPDSKEWYLKQNKLVAK